MRLRSLLTPSLLFPLLLITAPVTRADVIYNVLFSGGYPQYYPPTVGGTLVLNTPPPAVGSAVYSAPATPSSPYVIESIDIPFYGEDFTLSGLHINYPSGNIEPLQFSFENGVLTAISGELDTHSFVIFGTQAFPGSLPLLAEFIDYYGTYSTDLVSLSPATPTPTPEPSTLALLTTGLLGALLLTKRALT